MPLAVFRQWHFHLYFKSHFQIGMTLIVLPSTSKVRSSSLVITTSFLQETTDGSFIKDLISLSKVSESVRE